MFHLLKSHLFHLICPILSIILVAFSIFNFGPGITPDSVQYISASENFIKSASFISFDGSSLINWPPMWPFLISIFSLFGHDPFLLSGWLNAFMLAGTVIISISIFKKLEFSSNITLLGSILITLSLPLLKISVMAWSEITFCFLVTLFIFMLLRKDKFSENIATLSLIAALASLTRYQGIAIIIAGTAIIFTNTKKIKLALKFLFLSSIPISIWGIRNYNLSETIFGHRISPGNEFTNNLNDTFDVISSWISTSPFISVFVIVLLSIGLISAFLNNNHRKDLTISLVTLLFSLIAVMIYSSTQYQIDPIENRFLAPTFPIFVILSLISIERLILLTHFRENLVCIFISLIWIASNVFIITSHVTDWNSRGAFGFNHKIWTSSPLIDEILKLPLNATIFSNAPEAIYYLSKRKSKSTPTKSGYEPYLNSLNNSKNNFLVWFPLMKRDYLIGIPSLRAGLKTEEISNHGVLGQIYIISPKSDEPSSFAPKI